MTRQKSENRIVPKDPRKLVPTRGYLGGGKAIPVSKQAQQLGLFPVTVENPASAEVDDTLETDVSESGVLALPKAAKHKENDASTTTGRVIELLEVSFHHVASKKGAPGPDGQTIEEVREHLSETLANLSSDLAEGRYQPGSIRRVDIPKPGGGKRGLGVPNVIDRTVQEAVRRVIEPLFEPNFHPGSHGFRPGRSCHTAIMQAKGILEEGFEWVVDIDLEKFFDRIPHQRLLARLEERISDRNLLDLIHRMLKARVVMPDGVLVRTEEGAPQGSPLSPLLSNIVLDELDKELERRGHRFVRYADDCKIYVRSRRAGQRVMTSVTKFIEGRLRLKVNQDKSAVALSKERHFLGFFLKVKRFNKVEITLSKRSLERIKERILELTPRNWGGTLKSCISRINKYLRGWFGFFWICNGRSSKNAEFGYLDGHIRRRLRAILLKQWRRKRTIARKLIARGVKPKMVWSAVSKGKRGLWKLSRTFAVHKALGIAYFVKEQGLFTLLEQWRAKHQPEVVPGGQLTLPWG